MFFFTYFHHFVLIISSFANSQNLFVNLLRKLPDGTDLLIEYKTLLSDWKTYMDLVFEYDTDPVFTDAMRYNQYFNFTQYIMDYSIEFFKALDGSRLSPENYTDPTWANIGKI